MKNQASVGLPRKNFLPVTVYEPRKCEHGNCVKLGLFGFLQRHEPRWFCYAHKDAGEEKCRGGSSISN